MKKSLIFFSLAFVLTSKAQTYVPIHDISFAFYLQGLIPSAMNGTLLDVTNTLVTTATKSIDVSGRNITILDGIQYFSSLTYLSCSHNNITISSIPAILPNSLTYLDISSCYSLTGLPTLPNSLIYLYCGGDKIAGGLPQLPNSLQTLACWGNSLTSLPPLPNSLTYLECTQNKLTNLPQLPNSLQTLHCSSNNLTNLPALPNTLTNLECSHNNITCFPFFPASLTFASIGNNPFICLPNYTPAIYLHNANYLSYPLCATGNSNGCAVAGIKEFNLNNDQIRVYPNPNSGSFKFNIDNEIENGELVLLNSLGQIVHEQIVKRGVNQIITNTVSSGLYHYIIQQNKQQIGSGKLIIE